jgi:2-oxoglutarate dehydrogenase E1 component
MRAPASAAAGADAHAQKQAGVLKLVTAYRSRGHYRRATRSSGSRTPSGTRGPSALGLWSRPNTPDLDPAFHGLAPADMETEFNTSFLAGPQRLKLKDLIARLKATYASSIGAEFMHIADSTQRRWVHEHIERAGGDYALTADEKKELLEKLVQADGLGTLPAHEYVGQKRFSLEGGDSLIPLVDELLDRGGNDGLRDFVIGMAHRGRLNVLVNILGKAPQKLFAEFEGKFEHIDDPAHSGRREVPHGFLGRREDLGPHRACRAAFNPSHLEIVNPVVTGSVRARQTHRHDAELEQVIPVLIHGDAALAGQGVNMELFNMSQARGFAVGGTIHIVVNNQVGFTISNTHDARSTMYCTDVAKMVGAPGLPRERRRSGSR